MHTLDDSEVLALPDREQLKDALIVIDEAHEFYVASREALPKQVEEFFAKHRHHGNDIILISQWYKRLHGAVRGRVERKYVFQKLSALGSKNRYTVRQMATIGPDKWEQVDLQTRKYDPEIFPLYQSVAEGTANIATYDQGATTAWRKIIMWSIVMIPLSIMAIMYLTSFFTGGIKIVDEKKPFGVSVGQRTSDSPLTKNLTPTSVLPEKKSGPNFAAMKPEVAYIFEIATRARPRLAGLMITQDMRPAGIVEFRDAQGPAIERLTLSQLRSMGLDVVVMPYGVLMKSGDDSIVATNWPLPPEPQADDTRRDDDAKPRRAEPSDSEPQRGSTPAPVADSRQQDDNEQGAFRAYVPPASVRTSRGSQSKAERL